MNEPKKTTEKKEYITKKELNEAMDALLSKVVEAVKPNTSEEQDEPEVKSGNITSEDSYIPVEINDAIDKYLGKDFGREARYPSNSPREIHIFVPKNKSNATDAHWKFYNSDVRTIVLKNNEGLEAVVSKLKLIAQNLNKPKTL